MGRSSKQIVIAPDDFGTVVALGRGVEKGERVEVDADTAEALELQGWKRAGAGKSTVEQTEGNPSTEPATAGEGSD